MNAKMVTRIVVEMTYDEAEELISQISDIRVDLPATLIQLEARIEEAL